MKEKMATDTSKIIWSYQRKEPDHLIDTIIESLSAVIFIITVWVAAYIVLAIMP